MRPAADKRDSVYFAGRSYPACRGDDGSEPFGGEPPDGRVTMRVGQFGGERLEGQLDDVDQAGGAGGVVRMPRFGGRSRIPERRQK
jgi:hypothetical protein